MAIDTRKKRASVAGLVLPFMLGVHVDATKPAAWRQSAAWSYSGIAAESASYLTDGTPENVHWRTTENVDWRTLETVHWRTTEEVRA